MIAPAFGGTEYERELRHELAAAARESARIRGRHTSRPPRLSEAQTRGVRSLRSGGESITELVRTFGVSRETICRAPQATQAAPEGEAEAAAAACWPDGWPPQPRSASIALPARAPANASPSSSQTSTHGTGVTVVRYTFGGGLFHFLLHAGFDPGALTASLPERQRAPLSAGRSGNAEKQQAGPRLTLDLAPKRWLLGRNCASPSTAGSHSWCRTNPSAPRSSRST